jgi:hypothetical protein
MVAQCLLFAALTLTVFFIWRAMAPAYQPGDVIQDDARQHIFWMGRLRDPELFPNDLIADYSQWRTPPGLSFLYWALSPLINPILASKLLPWALGIAMALFTFLLVRHLHPSPSAAFLAAVLLGWDAWRSQSLPSATPRAFALPLIAALVWSLASRRLALSCCVVVLGALVYPVVGAIGVALLGIRLVQFRHWRAALKHERPAWLAFVGALVLACAALLPGQAGDSRFGPVVSKDEMERMAEFRKDGVNSFFVSYKYSYIDSTVDWSFGQRVRGALEFQVPDLHDFRVRAALALPVLLLFGRFLPAARRLSGRASVLLQLLAASYVLFVVAHLVLFRLYYPDRYVTSSRTLVIDIAAAVAVAIVIETAAALVRSPWRAVVAAVIALAIGIGLAVYPVEVKPLFRRDLHPEVTTFLQAQPKDFLVAGVPIDTNSIPSFAERPVLASFKHADAFHLGYYRQLRPRIEALINAYYAESRREIADFAQRYGVDAFLVNRLAFDKKTYAHAWSGSHNRWQPFAPMVAAKLRQPRRFALLELARSCAVLDDGQVAVVPSSCLTGRSAESSWNSPAGDSGYSG